MKRLVDVVISVAGIIILCPVFIIVSILIKIDSSGPVFFRQTRVGQFEKNFKINKFRTMVADAKGNGTQLTIGKDKRITKLGSFLRKYKIDEIPQLFNVLVGEMSIVGPRPEVPKYVQYYSDEDKKNIFTIRPGITDNSSIEFINENEMLAGVGDPEIYYTSIILPKKISAYRKYVEENSLLSDAVIMLKTVLKIFI